MRIDLHCHTHYSRDSLTTFDALLHRMDLRKLSMVAVTDHNTIAGALEFHRRAPKRFVVGEEIRTLEGELLALFVKERVPPDLPVVETIDRIHDQGGLAGAAHPLDRLRSEAMGREKFRAIHAYLDFVEIFNARVTFSADNRLAREMAVRWGLPGSAGSDAHAPLEVGRAYVEMPCFEGPQDFIDCLAQAQVGGRLSNPFVHLISVYAKWRARWGAP
jgi:predicted metal-dependent phosphoesterase TrpH